MRFRGLTRSTAHVVNLFALSNLWMAQKHLMAMIGAVRAKTACIERGANPAESVSRERESEKSKGSLAQTWLTFALFRPFFREAYYFFWWHADLFPPSSADEKAAESAL